MATKTKNVMMNWDLSSYFSSFNSEEMKEFKKFLINDSESLYNESSVLDGVDVNNINRWVDILKRYEDLIRRYSHIRSYISCLTSADSNNQDYLKEEADLGTLGSGIEKIDVEILRALRNASTDALKGLKSCEALEGCEYYIDRLTTESGFRMSGDKEILNTDLRVDGIDSWGRLYNTMSGRLSFTMKFPDGRTEILPMSQRRSLMENSDRSIRQAAFHGGNDAWRSVDYIAAAALNSIAGTRLTLNRHRGIENFLDVALFQSAVSRETLEAMFEAIYEHNEIPREILSEKASMMGTKGVAWYDLGAENDFGDRQEVGWEKAKQIIYDSFSSKYPDLAEFYSGLCSRNWVEWEPREGKRPGGFCTTSLLSNESRIFMTYNYGIGDIITLAHETGHAYHSYLLRETRPYKRFYPMTLAESASTFAEMILTGGMLEGRDIKNSEKMYILSTELEHGAIFLMDIPVRFEFEKRFYEERSSGSMSVNRLYELMSETQRNILGDILIEEDPFFWISKLHFYITGLSFYNFPYSFGYLLSRALYSRFSEEGKTFLGDFEKLLKLSGSLKCEDVIMNSIGEDITKKEFWSRSILSLRKTIEDFRKLSSRGSYHK